MSNENIDINKSIKIRRIKNSGPSRCSISKVGNNLVEVCENDLKCKTVNGMLDCPGYNSESNTYYGLIEDVGLDNTFNGDRYNFSEEQEHTEFDLIRNQQSENSEYPTAVSAVSDVVNQNTIDTVRDTVNRTLTENNLDNIRQNVNDAINVGIPRALTIMEMINAYKNWLILCFCIFCLIIIGLLLYSMSFFDSAPTVPTQVPIIIETPTAPVSTMSPSI